MPLISFSFTNFSIWNRKGAKDAKIFLQNLMEHECLLTHRNRTGYRHSGEEPTAHLILSIENAPVKYAYG